MSKINKERASIRIFKELSDELGLIVNFFCYDWVIRISKDGKTKHVIGYDWEINSSAAHLITKDKSACYEILNSQKIPAIEHILILSPQFQNYTGEKSSWDLIINYAKKHNNIIVCKPNVGTGGNDVFRVTGQLQLETCVHELFSKHRAICLSPFYEIETEFRVIILNNVIELVYSKQKPQILGNGTNTILELIVKTFGKNCALELQLDEIEFFSILGIGEVLEIGWKHNLSKGAKPKIIQDGELREELGNLAIKTAKVLNISFASIDIVIHKNKYLVLEVNSGMMMEKFASINEINYQTAKSIYRKALLEMFKE